MKDFLRSVSPEFESAGKYDLSCEDKQQADAGSCNHFYEESEESAELQPL